MNGERGLLFSTGFSRRIVFIYPIYTSIFAILFTLIRISRITDVRMNVLEITVLVVVFTLCAGNIFCTRIERRNCGKQGVPAFKPGVKTFAVLDLLVYYTAKLLIARTNMLFISIILLVF
jgi:hypothetical protein